LGWGVLSNLEGGSVSETTEEITAGVVRFGIADTKIAELRGMFDGLQADTPDGYREVTKAIAVTRTLRVNVEKTRKELKASALEYGRRVDSEAKRITALLEEIETPLKDAKQAVDDEKARIKAEQEAKERAERESKEAAERAEREAKEKAIRDAEEARIKAEREAEEARLAEERKALEAERAKLEAERAAERERAEAEQRKIAEQQAAERAKLDAERRAIEAKQEVERERLAAEQRKLDEQREEANRIERERLAAIKAEQDCKEAELNARLEAERIAKEEAEQERLDKIEAERIAKEHAEAEAAEAARLEALRPDAERILAFARVLRAIEIPAMATDEGQQLMSRIEDAVTQAAEDCEMFYSNNKAEQAV